MRLLPLLATAILLFLHGCEGRHHKHRQSAADKKAQAILRRMARGPTPTLAAVEAATGACYRTYHHRPPASKHCRELVRYLRKCRKFGRSCIRCNQKATKKSKKGCIGVSYPQFYKILFNTNSRTRIAYMRPGVEPYWSKFGARTCPAGKAKGNYGRRKCKRCTGRYYSSRRGQAKCKYCPPSKRLDRRHTACKSYPPKRSSPPPPPAEITPGINARLDSLTPGTYAPDGLFIPGTIWDGWVVERSLPPGELSFSSKNVLMNAKDPASICAGEGRLIEITSFVLANVNNTIGFNVVLTGTDGKTFTITLAPGENPKRYFPGLGLQKCVIFSFPDSSIQTGRRLLDAGSATCALSSVEGSSSPTAPTPSSSVPPPPGTSTPPSSQGPSPPPTAIPPKASSPSTPGGNPPSGTPTASPPTSISPSTQNPPPPVTQTPPPPNAVSPGATPPGATSPGASSPGASSPGAPTTTNAPAPARLNPPPPVAQPPVSLPPGLAQPSPSPSQSSPPPPVVTPPVVSPPAKSPVATTPSSSSPPSNGGQPPSSGVTPPSSTATPPSATPPTTVAPGAGQTPGASNPPATAPSQTGSTTAPAPATGSSPPAANSPAGPGPGPGPA